MTLVTCPGHIGYCDAVNG